MNEIKAGLVDMGEYERPHLPLLSFFSLCKRSWPFYAYFSNVQKKTHIHFIQKIHLFFKIVKTGDIFRNVFFDIFSLFSAPNGEERPAQWRRGKQREYRDE